MKDLDPNPIASTADPATPTLSLAEQLTQMSDDIRAEMDACDRGPAGQVARAWLGLILIIYRWLAELAGKPVPTWMEDALADADRAEGGCVRDGQAAGAAWDEARAGGASGGGFHPERDAAGFAADWPAQVGATDCLTGDEASRASSARVEDDSGAYQDATGVSRPCDPTCADAAATTAPYPSAAARRRRRTSGRWLSQIGRREPCLEHRVHQARIWSATVQSLRHR